ncbi:MAG: N-acetyltransferase [Planctomycetaceae bacterium]
MKPESLLIREEQPGDVSTISTIIESAFRDHPHSDQTEHLLVDRLRAKGAITLSLLAESESQPVAHIAFSKVKIDGKFCGWYGLAPVAVLPESQSRGIGSALIREGLTAIQTQFNAQGCDVLGDPAYYQRIGFRADPALTLPGFPPEYFMSLSFTDATPTGVVEYDSAFTEST